MEFVDFGEALEFAADYLRFGGSGTGREKFTRHTDREFLTLIWNAEEKSAEWQIIQQQDGAFEVHPLGGEGLFFGARYYGARGGDIDFGEVFAGLGPYAEPTWDPTPEVDLNPDAIYLFREEAG